MEIALQDITIGPRFRQDLGDIAGLAESIKTIGLLHAIIVSTRYELIVGRRRLAAHEHLGLETIEAWVVDLEDPLAAEIDENEQRKDYTISERVAIAEAREERAKQEAKQRQRQHGQTAPGRKKNTSVTFTEVIESQPPARDTTAKNVGLSWPTYAKAKKVVAAAREDPEFQSLLEAMDHTGNVTRAYNQLPPYLQRDEARDEEPTPRKVRHIKYNSMMQRLDALFQTMIIPHVQRLTPDERHNLGNLVRLYLDIITDEKEPVDAHSV